MRKKKFLLLVCLTCLFVILYWFLFKCYALSKYLIQIGETGYSCLGLCSHFCNFSLLLLIRSLTLLIPWMWQMLLIFFNQAHIFHSIFKTCTSSVLLSCLLTSFSSEIHSFWVWWWREKYGQPGFLISLFFQFLSHISLLNVSFLIILDELQTLNEMGKICIT